jgi:hypothetical protein
MPAGSVAKPPPFSAEPAAHPLLVGQSLQVSMSHSSQSAVRAALRKPGITAEPTSGQPPIEPDRPLHVRFEITRLGRFMRADKQEFPCRIHNISIGDAAFHAPVAVELGERIVAYLDHIGGIEGVVTRVLDTGFALKIAATQHKREKLAAQITWLINRSELDGIEARRSGHERIASGNQSTVLRLPDDSEIQVKLQDVSISGASVLTDQRPPIGCEVILGKLRALVVRHHAEGLGVQFLDIQNPDALRRYFG